jgi:site-specific recombinase XerD
MSPPAVDWPKSETGSAAKQQRAGEVTGLSLTIKTPGLPTHMLRHACGYSLANKGHDTRTLQAYLGHRNIQHTVRYTELSPTWFKDFWQG